MGATWLALRAGAAGVPPAATVPRRAGAGHLPAIWLLAIIVAIGPGRAAARITPATVLHTE